jgi:hypothetical protein
LLPTSQSGDLDFFFPSKSGEFGLLFLLTIFVFFSPFLHGKIWQKFASTIKVASIYNLYFGKKNLLTYFNYNQNKEISQTSKQ